MRKIEVIKSYSILLYEFLFIVFFFYKFIVFYILLQLLICISLGPLNKLSSYAFSEVINLVHWLELRHKILLFKQGY